MNTQLMGAHTSGQWGAVMEGDVVAEHQYDSEARRTQFGS